MWNYTLFGFDLGWDLKKERKDGGKVKNSLNKKKDNKK